MAERFEATEEAKAAFPTVSEAIGLAASRMADDFIDMGHSPSEATSLVAHALLGAAWTIAATGRIADGEEPNPVAFLECAKGATERFSFPGGKAVKMEWRIVEDEQNT